LSMVAIVFNGATVSRVLKVIIDPVSDAIQFTLKMEINGNLVTFGSKNALRDGMKHFGIDLTGRIAHHMIPHEFWDNPLVQQAAKYFKNPFHIRFSNSHRDYNDMIRELLTELYGYLGEEGILNPKNAAKVLEALQDLLKRELEKLERLHSQGGNVSLSDINIDIMEILDLAGL